MITDNKCAKARPWLRGFIEDYQDGRPWGYAIFEDPTVVDERMERCMARIDLLLQDAQIAVFGGDHAASPEFKFEYLDWPEESEDGPGADHGIGEEASVTVVQSEAEVTAAPDPKLLNPEAQNEKSRISNTKTVASTATTEALLQQSDIKTSIQAVEENVEETHSIQEDDEDDAEIDLVSEDTEEDSEKNDDDEEVNESDGEDSEDDADIDLVRDLPSLRAHFKWVCYQKKRRKAHESLEFDRSGIPRGLLRKVFLVIDEDSVDSILANTPLVDNAWVWAIDPNYLGDVALMTKDGLREEYYGYMRVRVQQLVNNFWTVLYKDDLSLPTLWETAKQSHNCAFVSVDPGEARLFQVSMGVGSALRVDHA